MKEYERINKESVRALRLNTDEKGFGYGDSRFKGKTFDIEIDKHHIKRVIFGINEIWNTHLVAVISEVIRIDKPDIVDRILDQTAYENGWH